VGKDGRPSGRAVVTFEPTVEQLWWQPQQETPPPSPQSEDAAVSAAAAGVSPGARASADFFSELNTLKVADLKELCRGKGLMVGGVKGLLIERLVEHAAKSGGGENARENTSSSSSADGEESYDGLPGVVLSPEIAPQSKQESERVPSPQANMQLSRNETAAAEAQGMQRLLSAVCLLDGSSLQGRDIRVRPYYPSRPTTQQTQQMQKQQQTKQRSPSWEDDDDDDDDEIEDDVDVPEWGVALSTLSSSPESSKQYRDARRSGAASPPSSSRTNQRACVFFGNLAYGLDMQLLGEEIEAVCGGGSVVEIRPSQYGDYAHVDFASPEAAQVAVRELNNFALNNRPLRVDLAR